MNHLDKPVFTIHQLSQKLDIPKPTLRFWEKELDGIIVPFRTDGGQRRYAIGHIGVIQQIKDLRDKGMSLAEIKIELDNNSNSDSGALDLLSERIAEVVKSEIERYFNGAITKTRDIGDE